MDPVRFETHPSRYKHWKLEVEGARARLVMQVDPEHPMKPGYELKLNSYDLSVDIELADATQRIRFEHPEVQVVTVTSEVDKCFCSGANIYMLGLSTHSFKVNFCKFTNETRLFIEDASKNSGLRFLAACNGATAGGGYELALACDDIVLVDDGNSTVSFPETPLLAVLPGTGGLTRLVDKRHVRRDRADVFCTLAEGMKGKRSVEWGLIDATFTKSKFAEGIKVRADKLAEEVAEIVRGPAVALMPLEPTIEESSYAYKYVALNVDRETRTGQLTISAPTEAPPTDAASMVAQGSDLWSLRCFRELHDALLNLRFNEPEVGMITVRTIGNAEHVLAADKALLANQDNGFLREVKLLQARVLRCYDLTARSFFAVAEEESCFAGILFELALGADRFYMLEDDDEKVGIWTSEANAGAYLASNGLSRMRLHFFHTPEDVDKALARGAEGVIPSTEADEFGLPTIVADDIDFEDELRIAIEERASLSPDALTGMEASLRFPGPETIETKIFARLSAWQNWIFTRPNATGGQGALTLYGKPERPNFDWKRT
ncbi:MAG: benzoyl-CoA-dihydrodiol lyase [Myxococcales bacterium]|nr:benzoyl-CoA-dihydrodiol lyase [Myxococcales bacterium]